MDDKILGTLYGMAIGDAMGMPSELWSRRKVQNYFGYISEFLDGPEENDVACNFTKGQFTDDTQQALIIIDALAENHFKVSSKIIGHRLLQWADKLNAFDNNILGPSSLAALTAFKQGKETSAYSNKALTNGSAMRIAPIGTLFKSKDYKNLTDYVTDINQITHYTDVSIAGAGMVANAVSAACEDKKWDDIISSALTTGEYGMTKGAETFAASLVERTKLGVQYSKEIDNDQEFSKKLYDVIGTGTSLTESVPAALTMAYRTRDVKECALLCANLGGDTDTIGAMATAICGAKNGYSSIYSEWTDIIDSANPLNLKNYGELLKDGREILL
jgi:ADP-ribosylglycohydrolase